MFAKLLRFLRQVGGQSPAKLADEPPSPERAHVAVYRRNDRLLSVPQ